jgi:hypothetical protein
MAGNFCEVKLFQVKPDKVDEFEALLATLAEEQAARPGCSAIRYVKRFYRLDQPGQPPRALTRIVKCVKYYSYWEFDSIESYSIANGWFFDEHAKAIQKLLIMPFDINLGYSPV